jgi:hypothetical protein
MTNQITFIDNNNKTIEIEYTYCMKNQITFIDNNNKTIEIEYIYTPGEFIMNNNQFIIKGTYSIFGVSPKNKMQEEIVEFVKMHKSTRGQSYLVKFDEFKNID